MDAQTGGRCSQGVLSLAGRACRKKTAWIGYVLGRSVDQGERYGANSAEANTSPPAPGNLLDFEVSPVPWVCRWCGAVGSGVPLGGPWQSPGSFPGGVGLYLASVRDARERRHKLRVVEPQGSARAQGAWRWNRRDPQAPCRRGCRATLCERATVLLSRTRHPHTPHLACPMSQPWLLGGEGAPRVRAAVALRSARRKGQATACGAGQVRLGPSSCGEEAGHSVPPLQRLRACAVEPQGSARVLSVALGAADPAELPTGVEPGSGH